MSAIPVTTHPAPPCVPPVLHKNLVIGSTEEDKPAFEFDSVDTFEDLKSLIEVTDVNFDL